MYKKPRCKEYARGAFFLCNRKRRSYYIKRKMRCSPKEAEAEKIDEADRGNVAMLQKRML